MTLTISRFKQISFAISPYPLPDNLNCLIFSNLSLLIFLRGLPSFLPSALALFENGVIDESGNFLYRYSKSRESAVERLGRWFKRVMTNNGLDTTKTPYCLRHSFQDTLERLDVEERVIRHLFGKRSQMIV